MTAVKTVSFPSRSQGPLNRDRLRETRHRALQNEPDRTDAWRGEIEQFIELPREEPVKPCIVLQPMLGPHDGLDVTEAVTRAVAQELWNLHGGNDVMNWLEAERLLGEFIEAQHWPRGSPRAARA